MSRVYFVPPGWWPALTPHRAAARRWALGLKMACACMSVTAALITRSHGVAEGACTVVPPFKFNCNCFVSRGIESWRSKVSTSVAVKLNIVTISASCHCNAGHIFPTPQGRTAADDRVIHGRRRRLPRRRLLAPMDPSNMSQAPGMGVDLLDGALFNRSTGVERPPGMFHPMTDPHPDAHALASTANGLSLPALGRGSSRGQTERRTASAALDFSPV
ncbi:hypothetical protein G7046_g7204 [Stylonectria norvegica]|nr:hypothetical protein G7046_g7204 [Stylonectria norvegica]